jgi:hypothetical protein
MDLPRLAAALGIGATAGLAAAAAVLLALTRPLPHG